MAYSFWVCEKSDGVRVLVLIVATPEGQEVFLVRPSAPSLSAPNSADGTGGEQIDRKEQFYQNWGLVFPHQDGPEFNHSNTVLDGELVIDVEGDQVGSAALSSRSEKLTNDVLLYSTFSDCWRSTYWCATRRT